MFDAKAVATLSNVSGKNIEIPLAVSGSKLIASLTPAKEKPNNSTSVERAVSYQWERQDTTASNPKWEKIPTISNVDTYVVTQQDMKNGYRFQCKISIPEMQSPLSTNLIEPIPLTFVEIPIKDILQPKKIGEIEVRFRIPLIENARTYELKYRFGIDEKNETSCHLSQLVDQFSIIAIEQDAVDVRDLANKVLKSQNSLKLLIESRIGNQIRFFRSIRDMIEKEEALSFTDNFIGKWERLIKQCELLDQASHQGLNSQNPVEMLRNVASLYVEIYPRTEYPNQPPQSPTETTELLQLWNIDIGTPPASIRHRFHQVVSDTKQLQDAIEKLRKKTFIASSKEAVYLFSKSRKDSESEDQLPGHFSRKDDWSFPFDLMIKYVDD